MMHLDFEEDAHPANDAEADGHAERQQNEFAEHEAEGFDMLAGNLGVPVLEVFVGVPAGQVIDGDGEDAADHEDDGAPEEDEAHALASFLAGVVEPGEAGPASDLLAAG